MPAPAILAGLFSLVKSGLGSWFKGREIKQTAKLKIKILQATAEIERAKSAARAEYEYDNLAQSNMKGSWKDEYLVLQVSLPITLTFLTPYLSLMLGQDLTPQLAQAWALLAGIPTWYQVTFLGIIIATFGLRWMFNDKKLKAITGVMK